MSDGPVVGGYKQGTPITNPTFQPDPDEGSMPEVPVRAAPAGAVPRGEQHSFEAHNVVGANPQKAH